MADPVPYDGTAYADPIKGYKGATTRSRASPATTP